MMIVGDLRHFTQYGLSIQRHETDRCSGDSPRWDTPPSVEPRRDSDSEASGSGSDSDSSELLGAAFSFACSDESVPASFPPWLRVERRIAVGGEGLGVLLCAYSAAAASPLAPKRAADGLDDMRGACGVHGTNRPNQSDGEERMIRRRLVRSFRLSNKRNTAEV